MLAGERRGAEEDEPLFSETEAGEAKSLLVGGVRWAGPRTRIRCLFFFGRWLLLSIVFFLSFFQFSVAGFSFSFFRLVFSYGFLFRLFMFIFYFLLLFVNYIQRVLRVLRKC